MNDKMMMLDKLYELVDLAKDASSGYECAAVYSATQAIFLEFKSDDDEITGYALEKIHHACWHIKAAVGYDVTNDHSKSEHISWAYGAILSARNAFAATESVISR